MANDSLAPAQAIAQKWASAWGQPEVSSWLNVYAPDATYTDYAFFFIRRGHAGLEQHFKIWRTAHPDFHMEIAEVWPAKELGGDRLKCSIRTHNIGTFTNDMPTMKASGKKFDFFAVVDITWNKRTGLIEAIEEWYHKQFDADKLVERDQHLPAA